MHSIRHKDSLFIHQGTDIPHAFISRKALHAKKKKNKKKMRRSREVGIRSRDQKLLGPGKLRSGLGEGAQASGELLG